MVAPGPYWLDSSELAAAAFGLGIAHPPGHPLAALAGKALALVPLGPVAFRVGIAQAACGAVAAALAALLGAELARRAGEALGRRDPVVEAASALAAGIGFGLSHAAAMQAVRPEVYALHAALALAAVLALSRFDRTGDPRLLLVAALALGLGLANHHFLAALLLLSALPWVAWRIGRGHGPPVIRLVALAVVAGLLGLACYAYLPLRAARHPAVDWGAPSSLERFAWTVSARAFQRSLHHAEVAGAPAVAMALARELSWLLPLPLAAAWAFLRVRAARPLLLLCAGGALSQAAGPALVGFDADNPDAYGYLETAVALLVAMSGATLAGLAARWRSPLAGRIVAALAAVVAIGAGASRLPSISLARFHDTSRAGEALLDETPPRALLVTSYYQTVFPIWYLRSVEGQRPDLDHVHRHFLAWPGFRDEAILRAPSLAPLLGRRDVETAPLLALAASRAVRIEYDLDLDPGLVEALVPGVLVEAVAPGGSGVPPPSPLLQRRWRRLEARLDLGEPQTLRFVFWRAFLEAHRDCRRGQRAAARASIARARALLAGARDPDLEELAAKCR